MVSGPAKVLVLLPCYTGQVCVAQAAAIAQATACLRAEGTPVLWMWAEHLALVGMARNLLSRIPQMAWRSARPVHRFLRVDQALTLA